MNSTPSRLIVTIDTECDKSRSWRTASPLSFRSVTEAVPRRLQPLFARFGIRPTYLLSPEVIADASSREVLRSLSDVELTTHLHGDYVVPSIKSWDFAGTLTDEMQLEYGESLERAKMETLTELFRQQFGYQPLSFRAGRFGASRHTGRILQDLGYRVDSSVTPHVCWTTRTGEKHPDYRGYSEMPYTLGPEGDIARPGSGGILELPVTILPLGAIASNNPAEPIWFRPWYSDEDTLCRVLDYVLDQPAVDGVHRPLVMMFHNVELFPGASPYPQTEAEVQRYLDMMARVFERAERRGIQSCTMAEYAQLHASRAKPLAVNSKDSSNNDNRTRTTSVLIQLDPQIRIPDSIVETAIETHQAQPWFNYIFKERASRWDVVKPCQWIAQNITPDQPILSIGTGIGLNLFWLAERGYTQLIGTDIDPKAIAAGNEIAYRTHLPVTLVVDDALHPQFRDSKRYSVIEALNWCHLLKDFSLDQLLATYAPRMADDGVFIIDTIDTAFNRVPGNQFHTSDRNKPESERRPSEYCSRFSEADVRSAFERHGLAIEEIIEEHQTIPKRVYIGRAGRPKNHPRTTHFPTPRRPRVMLMADVPNWIFARHCKVLMERLGFQFDFDLKLQGQTYNEADYDLLYPLEWNLIPQNQIRTPAKYVTSIRSHCSWDKQDFNTLCETLRTKFASVHVVSERLKSVFDQAIPHVQVTSHGIDLAHFTPKKPVSAEAGKLRLGWAGNRKSPNKGFAEFIAPLAHLTGVELIFCGFSDRNLKLEEMHSFYESIDAYVCASDFEGNNNSLMEASAMARAIVTTDNGTVPEYLVDGESAVIVPRNAEAFKTAILTLRDNPQLRRELGNRAQQSVSQKFDWRIKAEQYSAWFKSVIDQREQQAAHVDFIEDWMIKNGDKIEELQTFGGLLLRKKKWALGTRVCQRLLELDPNNVQTLLLLAQCLLGGNEVETAAVVFKRIIEIDPMHSLAAGCLKNICGDVTMASTEAEIITEMPVSDIAKAIIAEANGLLDNEDLPGAHRLILTAFRSNASDDTLRNIAGETTRMARETYPLPNLLGHVQRRRINVAVLTYNALESTQLFLQSLKRFASESYNVFVVDNGSTDGTREWFSQLTDDNVFVEFSPVNYGVPGGRNRLIQMIAPFLNEDAYVVFCDNDLEMTADWIKPFLKLFQLVPDCGMAGRMGHEIVIQNHSRHLLPCPTIAAPVDVVSGGYACWIQARVIQAVGLFDEKLGLFWHEDDDYCVRAIAAGFEVFVVPNAPVLHHEHKSGEANDGIAEGGSRAHQAYLVKKWKKLGYITPSGRIRHSSRALISKIARGTTVRRNPAEG